MINNEAKCIDSMNNLRKTCGKCKKSLPVDLFVKDRTQRDGLNAKCKSCKRAQLAAWRKGKPHYFGNSSNEYKARNPEKRRAHRAVEKALLRGEIVRQPCSICGNTKADAHHDDYSKPLDVIWFCRLHHAEHHVKLRDQVNAQPAPSAPSSAP